MSTTTTETQAGSGGQTGTGQTGQQGGGSQADQTGQQTGQTGQQDQTTQEAQNVAALPKWAQDELAQARRDAAANRTGKTAAETEAQQAKDLVAAVQKALGQTSDGKPDPEKLTADLVAAQAAQRSTAVELQVYRLAGTEGVGADPEAMVDSKGFAAKVSDLDPNAKDFAEKVKAAMVAAIAENPRLKAQAAQGAAGASGTDMNGNTGKDKKPGSLEEAITNELVAQDKARKKTT